MTLHIKERGLTYPAHCSTRATSNANGHTSEHANILAGDLDEQSYRRDSLRARKDPANRWLGEQAHDERAEPCAGAIIIVQPGASVHRRGAASNRHSRDVSIAPILAAITLGIVGPTVFAEGNLPQRSFFKPTMPPTRRLPPRWGYAFGLGDVAVTSCLVWPALMPKRSISPGTKRRGRRTLEAEGTAANAEPALLVAVVPLFQTPNGAVLPFLAQPRTAAGDNPSVVTGVMTVVTQSTMVGAAILAVPTAKPTRRTMARIGFNGDMSAAMMPAAGSSGLTAAAHSWWWVIFVQASEGPRWA